MHSSDNFIDCMHTFELASKSAFDRLWVDDLSTCTLQCNQQLQSKDIDLLLHSIQAIVMHLDHCHLGVNVLSSYKAFPEWSRQLDPVKMIPDQCVSRPVKSFTFRCGRLRSIKHGRKTCGKLQTCRKHRLDTLENQFSTIIIEFCTRCVGAGVQQLNHR